MKTKNVNFPLVSIIVVNYNGRRFLKDCFSSLLNLNYPKNKLEIIMVDNGSQDGSVTYVRRYFRKVKIIKNKKNNYAQANNLGILRSKGEFIALVNNDTKADKNWLIPLVRLAKKDKRIGAVGSKILLPDGRLQSFGQKDYYDFFWGDRGLGDRADSPEYNVVVEVEGLCGAAVLFRRECFEDVGLLDEDFNMVYEDVDIGLRCRKKGWKLFICPDSIIYHKFHGSINRGGGISYWVRRNRLLFIAKHWPEKLPQAFVNKFEFTMETDFSTNNSAALINILGDVVLKVLKEKGLRKFIAIAPQLFNTVSRLYRIEKKYLFEIIRRQNDLLAKNMQGRSGIIFKKQ